MFGEKKSVEAAKGKVNTKVRGVLLTGHAHSRLRFRKGLLAPAPDTAQGLQHLCLGLGCSLRFPGTGQAQVHPLCGGAEQLAVHLRGRKPREPDSSGVSRTVTPVSGTSAWGTRAGVSPAAGDEGDTLTLELTYSSSSTHSSEFCCCRTDVSARRVARDVRTLLGKENRGLTWLWCPQRCHQPALALPAPPATH